MARLYTSEDEMHSRRITVDTTDEPCRFCGSRNAVTVDTSDEEYMAFVCCAACFTKLCSGIALD